MESKDSVVDKEMYPDYSSELDQQMMITEW